MFVCKINLLIIFLLLLNTKFCMCRKHIKCKVNLADFKSHPCWNMLNHAKCGISNARRIIGGTDASIGEYPWIARLGYTNEVEDVPLNESRLRFLCGGSIISKYHVLTAAHCILSAPFKWYITLVRLGEQYLDTNPDCDAEGYCNDHYVDYKVSKIYYHEKYKPVGMINDLGLLKTEKAIEFTAFINPICIMRNELLMKDLLDEMVKVVGWGYYLNNLKMPSNKLQTLELPVRDEQACADNYTEYTYKWLSPFLRVNLDNAQICAGGVSGHDACNGDSGGPLMKADVDGRMIPRYYLIGVVSYGSAICGEYVPGIYTNVTCYLPWILEHMAL